MKKWKKFAAVLAAAMVLSLGMSSMAYAAEGEINVNGMGVVMADPDTADISLSVETTGKTSEAAQKENNKIIQKVTAAMQDMGVTKDNIVTTYTSVYPQYNYDDNGNRSVMHYRSYTDLQVTTKDIDNAGKYIDAALKAGATGTNGVSFSVADQSAYYGQALQAAVKNAEKSAKSIADAYGRPLGAVKSVTENSRNAYAVETANLTMSKMMATEDSAAAAGGTTISYGKIQITANIAVTYSF